MKRIISALLAIMIVASCCTSLSVFTGFAATTDIGNKSSDILKVNATSNYFPTEEPTVSPEEPMYIVAGSEEFLGSSWDGLDLNNMMTPVGDLYKLVVPDTPVGDSYQIKVVENLADGAQNWFGDAQGNNITFNVLEECDVTVTYNPITDLITVTGDGVEVVTELEVSSMRVVGNGTGAWLNGASWDETADENLMTEISDNVYQITYYDVESSNNYQLRFAANGSWAVNWGGTYAGSGVKSDAVWNGNNNITVDVPYDLADVTLTLDLTNFNLATKKGAKFTVTVRDATNYPTEPPTEPPTEEPAKELTVNATSNIFPSVVQKLYKDDEKVTVSYKLTSSMAVENAQWILTFDSTKLEYTRENNTHNGKQTVSPNVSGLVYNVKENTIKGNFSDINLIDFDNDEEFVTITFNVIGKGTANVNLNLEYLGVGYYESDYDLRDENIVDSGELRDLSSIYGFENASISTTTTVDSKSCILGDLNGDRKINIGDVTIIQKILAKFKLDEDVIIENFDFNKDGYNTIDDATAIQKFIADI